MHYKNSILASTIAFLIATSCCWLPALLIALGGGSAFVAMASGLERWSGAFMAVGIGLLAFGWYQYRAKAQKTDVPKVAILQSVLTCPACGHKKEETMPTDACQYFYECNGCKVILKPLGKDCCVYCSYGTVPCPPIQLDEACC